MGYIILVTNLASSYVGESMHETIGLNGTCYLCILGSPYILGVTILFG